jgi:rubrerythrin
MSRDQVPCRGPALPVKSRVDSMGIPTGKRAVSPDKQRELCAACLDQHVETESEIMEEYRALAGPIESGPIRFLIDFILHDEERHHGLLRMMAKYLRIKNRRNDKLPWVIDRQELVRHMHKLQEHERDTIAACQDLKTQVPADESEFFGALLDALILDSEKHERLLLAVERMAKS